MRLFSGNVYASSPTNRPDQQQRHKSNARQIMKKQNIELKSKNGIQTQSVPQPKSDGMQPEILTERGGGESNAAEQRRRKPKIFGYVLFICKMGGREGVTRICCCILPPKDKVNKEGKRNVKYILGGSERV